MPRNREPSIVKSVTLVVVAALNAACAGPKAILVPQGEPVQLAEPVEALIFIELPSGEWTTSPNRVTIPAGWWVLPDPE